MNYLSKLCLTVLCLVSTQLLFAQYSKVSFKSNAPLKMIVDGETINENYAKYFKVRMIQSKTYNVKFVDESGREAITLPTFAIGEKERKSNYKITYKKRKDDYWFSVLNSKDKVSFADGLRNIGTVEYSAESNSARADSDGNVSVKHSKSEGSLNVGALGDGVDAVGSLFGDKDAKKKKKLQADSRPVVVIKIK